MTQCRDRSKSEAEEEIEEDIELATPFNASSYSCISPLYVQKMMAEQEVIGNGTGCRRKARLPHINQSKLSGRLHWILLYLVKDHRTEGGASHQQARSGNYLRRRGRQLRKSTLTPRWEGAVYGLYAAEDIIHPDGKTGVVFFFFGRADCHLAATDKNGDASFLVITEETETSKNVLICIKDNIERNEWLDWKTP